MKITLPENIGEITLEQYQKYHELTSRDSIEDYEFNKRKVSIFTGIKYHSLDHISNKDFKEILEQIDIALGTDQVFAPKFTLNEIDFGFIPNLDKIKTKEFVDMDLYRPDEIETLHKLMAILFRPIKNYNGFDDYSIKGYNGTERYGELMKQMPLSVVNGAMVFFCSLSKELLSSIQKSTVKELQKVSKLQTTLKSGDGMQQLKG